MNTQWNTRKFIKVLRDEICEILKAIPGGNQILVVQSQVLTLLNQLINFSELTEKTPVRKIVVLNEELLENITNISATMEKMVLVFLVDVRSDLTLPTQLKTFLNEFKVQEVNVVLSTWKTQISNNLLDEEFQEGSSLSHFVKSQLKELPSVQLYNWNMFPIPEIDDNLLLCNILFNNDGENMYIPSNYSLQTTTRGILIDNMVNCLQSLISETNSIITNTIGFGDESIKFLDLLRKRIENKEDSEDKFINETLNGEKYSGLEKDLIVIERDVDPLTPLLTQLTYAGLLDDLHGISPNGKLNGVDSVTLQYQKDDVWDELKYLNFGALGPRLNQSARDLQDSYDARHKAESVGEIRQFVDSLSSLQEKQKLLKMHTTLSSGILQGVANNEDYQFNRILELEQDLLLQNLDSKGSYDAITDLLYEGQVDLDRILRLACLSSTCKNGLKDKDYDTIKREFIDSFGIEVCFQLQRLTQIGIFSSKSLAENLYTPMWKKEYRYISSWLDTLPSVDEEERDQKGTAANHDASHPKDATFAYCGVVPLTTRFVQLLYDRSVLSKNYSAQQPFILSRAPSIAKTTELFGQIYGKASIVKQESWMPPIRKNKRRVTVGKQDQKKTSDIAIIVFLGGVTLGEVATIRYLQDRLREKDIAKRFIIVSDGLINGNRMVGSCLNAQLYNKNKKEQLLNSL